MMHSPLMKWIGMGTWVITSLACINIGLSALGIYDFWYSNFMLTSGLMKPLMLLVGFSGLWSLMLLVMACTSKGACGSCGCACKK